MVLTVWKHRNFLFEKVRPTKTCQLSLLPKRVQLRYQKGLCPVGGTPRKKNCEICRSENVKCSSLANFIFCLSFLTLTQRKLQSSQFSIILHLILVRKSLSFYHQNHIFFKKLQVSERNSFSSLAGLYFVKSVEWSNPAKYVRQCMRLLYNVLPCPLFFSILPSPKVGTHSS